MFNILTTRTHVLYGHDGLTFSRHESCERVKRGVVREFDFLVVIVVIVTIVTYVITSHGGDGNDGNVRAAKPRSREAAERVSGVDRASER